MDVKEGNFKFNISLSILNHLGRNLYRNFITVIGEAISNSRDADASNVRIEIDKEGNSFSIKDDGTGMSADDFQDKFLRIGYSKRKDKTYVSEKKRSTIGRKGIGKLALLSCAEKIIIISKKKGEEFVGGVINNSGLDQAIQDDLLPSDYKLEDIDPEVLKSYIKDFEQGTIIIFESIKDGIKNRIDYIKQLIALYFRFSLYDKSFNIFLNNQEIGYKDLSHLSEKTEFLWEINDIDDPLINELNRLKESKKISISELDVKGFIASVEKPSDLKIMGTGEKITIDLFVNGRLREKDILKHMPSARIPESYLYGQIHFDALDSEDKDRFTSSREGILDNDELYQQLLSIIKSKMGDIIKEWDDWRINNREDGDSEDNKIPKKERKARELFNSVSTGYSQKNGSETDGVVDKWIDELGGDAQYNFGSYAECFISENLLRRYIFHKKIQLTTEATETIKTWQGKENTAKNKGNISIEIRQNNNDLLYLSMNDLAYMIDKVDPKNAGLSRDSDEYKPMRDAVAHTALLTDVAKTKLTSVFNNIKGRVVNLLKNI